MTKAIKKAESNLPVELSSSWEDESEIRNDDILIPRLLVMQGTSELVGAEKKKQGEIIDSLTEETLGGRGKAVSFIPFKFVQEWRIMEDIDGTFKYKERMPLTAENEHLPWLYEENGVEMRRDKVLNFFCIRPDDLDGLPVIVSFSRTGYREGKRLITFFKTCKMQKKSQARKVWELDTLQQKKDTNTYYIPKLAQGRDSTEEELQVAFNWFNELKTKKVEVAGEEIDSDEAPF